MPDLSTYAPDPHDHQQLVPWSPTSPYDCGADSAAWAADADQGRKVVDGRTVRLNTNEAKPDPRSPGLNLPQVDAGVYRATNGRVNLRLGADGIRPTVTVTQARRMVEAGRRVEWQFHRGRLGRRIPGLLAMDPFDGLHAGGLILEPFDSLRLFDPLVPLYLKLTWADVQYAAINGSAVPGTGFMNVLATRDVVPSAYTVRFDGPMRFNVYRTGDDRIIDGVKTIVIGSRDVVRLVHRKTTLWFPGLDIHGEHSRTGSSRNAAQLISGPLADTPYCWVNLDNPRLTYREVLP